MFIVAGQNLIDLVVGLDDGFGALRRIARACGAGLDTMTARPVGAAR